MAGKLKKGAESREQRAGSSLDAYMQAWSQIARALWGSPFDVHHEGERWRKRRYDGRWMKVAHSRRLIPHWRAQQRRKDVGAMGRAEAAFATAGEQTLAAVDAWKNLMFRLVDEFIAQGKEIGTTMQNEAESDELA